MSSDEAFTGYWNRPDADEKAIRDGWYHTGDVGRLDEDGDLWVVGRVDDMVVSGGENIHPIEVEDVSRRAPGVQEVAVVGAVDERLGQRVVACVVADEGVTADDLDAFCLAVGGARPLQTAAGVPIRVRAAEEPFWEDPSTHAAGGARVSGHDGFRVASDTERGVATITLDVPGKPPTKSR